MNREDVIRMAREAGVTLNFTMYRNGPIGSFTMDEFMKLMEATYADGQSAEREACAKVCEAKSDTWAKVDDDTSSVLQSCANAIRARGTQ